VFILSRSTCTNVFFGTREAIKWSPFSQKSHNMGIGYQRGAPLEAQLSSSFSLQSPQSTLIMSDYTILPSIFELNSADHNNSIYILGLEESAMSGSKLLRHSPSCIISQIGLAHATTIIGCITILDRRGERNTKYLASCPQLERVYPREV
jgi:hypothetical protein